MVRVVKTAAIRQDEILDVAQRLFLERGYDDTPIQAIIDAVGIAKGTFYHHYPSKPALLDALVQRMVVQSLAVVRPILEDPTIGAVDRLCGVFLRAGAWKADNRAVLKEMRRALQAPANARMFEQMQRDSTRAMVPIVATIIRQGIAEGVFDTRFPEPAARIVMELGMVLGRTIGDALFVPGPPPIAALVTEVEAYNDAIGRLLGAVPGTVTLVDPSHLRLWFEPDPTPGAP
jgi:AcrR family transcriptional regulator